MTETTKTLIATILTILVSFIHVINFVILNVKFCVPSRHKIVVVIQ